MQRANLKNFKVDYNVVMNDREQKIKEFKALDDISHVLTVPARYIGSVNEAEIETYLFKDGKFTYETVKYTPGLLKIIEEILDNSVDAYLNSSDRKPITVKVNMTKTSVEVIDTGCGIPVVKYRDDTGKLPELNGKYLAELAWGRLKAGGSFKEHRVGAGTHGEGASLTNIFSKVFIGTTDDGKHKCRVLCRDNMHEIKTKLLESSGRSGTSVYFEPDLSRFRLNEITQQHFDLIYQRLVNLSIAFPELKFYFNDSKINVNVKNFIAAFSEHSEYVKSDNTIIGVFPSSNDEFQQYTYVNGLRIKDGGVHIDYISSMIVNPIREKLVKKYKTIKPADIKNRLGLVVFLKDFANPQFNSQTKDELKNPVSDVVAHIAGKIDFEKFAKDIMKNDAVMSPIIDMFKLKEELKARHELKQAKKVKVKSDKYFPGIGEKKYLFLVEGLSAGGGLMKCLGRNGKYFYCLRGLALNAYDSSIQKIAANQEIKEVMNILNLDLTKKNEEKQQIEFEKIVIATDADIDGTNIASMLFGWWYRLCPDLYKQHKIYRLNTPVVIVEDAKENIKDWFFNLNEFKKWEATNTDKKLKIIYLKGLGSLSTVMLDFIIQKQGFDSLLEEYTLDGQSDEYFKNWLGPNAEPRKKYMKEYDFDINTV